MLNSIPPVSYSLTCILQPSCDWVIFLPLFLGFLGCFFSFFLSLFFSLCDLSIQLLNTISQLAKGSKIYKAWIRVGQCLRLIPHFYLLTKSRHNVICL
ncbi:MAG: hypothetical protein D8H99_55415 [Streptococcus sp.]|nr:MAG: hypothetical protein D8H99_55415 [Streptococcus sp.]